MKVRLVLERTVLILSVFVLAGTNRCRDDYFFATESKITLTGTPAATSSAAVTGTVTVTPTATSGLTQTRTPVPTASGSASSSSSSSSASTAALIRAGTSGVAGDAKNADVPDSAGLLAELATLDKPELSQATRTPGSAQGNPQNLPVQNGQLGSNWLGDLYKDSDEAGSAAKVAGNLDSDGDGYADGLEEANGTDRLDPGNFPDWLKSTSLSARLSGVDDDGDGVSNTEEKAQGTDPFKQDSDGDGIADGAEKLSGSNPLNAQSLPIDSDRDGLSDDFERAQGTNVHSADSDGDGVIDSLEAAIGSNPVIKDSDQDGISDGREVQSGGDPIIADVRKN